MTDRLKALPTQGVSIWLDDLSRERLETGNLADLVENSYVVGRHHQPDDLRRGARRRRALRRAGRATSPRAGVDVDEAICAITTDDVRDACDVLRRATTPPTASTAGSRSRSTPAWPTTPTATIAEAKRAVGAVDRPNLFIKIPATTRALPGDHRRRSAEGISVNVTLIFGLERYRAVMDAFLAGLEQAQGERPRPVQDPLGRVVLRLPRRHRGRQAARRRSAPTRPTALRGQGRRSPTRGSPTQAYEEVFAGDRWAALDGRRRPPAAPAVGLDRRQEPGLPRHAVRRRPRRRRTPSTRCRRRPCDAFADHGEVAGDPVTGTYAEAQQVMDDLADGRHRLRRRDRDARARGRREVRGLLGRARRDGQGPARAGAGRDVSETLEVAADRSRRATRSRAHVAGAGRRRRSPAGCSRRTPTLWGPEAEDEAAKRLAWVDLPATSRPLVAEVAALRGELAGAGSTTSCSAAWAARRWRPR